jgi:hypothetical protein
MEFRAYISALKLYNVTYFVISLIYSGKVLEQADPGGRAS